jgi:hypothetical protein
LSSGIEPIPAPHVLFHHVAEHRRQEDAEDRHTEGTPEDGRAQRGALPTGLPFFTTLAIGHLPPFDAYRDDEHVERLGRPFGRA